MRLCTSNTAANQRRHKQCSGQKKMFVYFRDVDLAKLPEQTSGNVTVGESGNELQGNNIRSRRAELVEDGSVREHTHPFHSCFPPLVSTFSFCACLAHKRLFSV